MKALVTIAMLVDVEDHAEGEELRDNIDRSIWTGFRDSIRAAGVEQSEIDDIITFFPATVSFQPERETA